MDRTGVSTANVAMVVPGGVERSAEYMRYSNGPRTLTWDTPGWIGDRVCCVEAILKKKCLLCKYERRRRKSLRASDYLNLYKISV
jgi:hypothetical protein